MENITVSVPSSVLVDLKHHTEAMEASLEGKSAEWFGWAIAFALRQSAGDADAGLKEGTDEEKRDAVKAKFDKLASGTIPSGGGGGRGASLGDDSEALHRWLLSEGHKGKKKDIRERLLSAVRATILNSVEPAQAKTLKDDRDSLEALVVEHKEAVETMIRDTQAYKDFLAAVKRERNPTSGLSLAGLKIG